MDKEQPESINQDENSRNVNKKYGKIAVYKRYSTHRQDLKTQDQEIANYLEYKKYDPDKIIFYKDESESGKKFERPEFQKMIKDIENGLITEVICLKLDRLARSSRDLQNFLHLAKKNGANLIVIKDNIDTSTPHGKLFFDLMGAFAEFETSVITERMKSGRQRAKDEGKNCHRPKKDVNVRRIADLHETNKLSFNAIKKIFDSEGNKLSLTTIISRYKEYKKWMK